MGEQHFAFKRFEIPANALRELLKKGKFQKEKGLALYNNKGRDILFRLEGLCRIYREINDKKFFDKWYKEFKLLEDSLGVIDFNLAIQNEFSVYPELKKGANELFGKKVVSESARLAALLKENGWQNEEKIDEFITGLAQTEAIKNDDDAKNYGEVMCTEMNKLTSKYEDGEIDPFMLEEGLHEFRRRLRWVSIYAQIGNGLVQLRTVKAIPDDILKYCTNEIVKSPFNLLPKPQKGQDIILVQSHYFYAVSWLIYYLGVLKDTALRNGALQELQKFSGTKSSGFKLNSTIDPREVFNLAENAIDQFIYKDLLPMRICRDIQRSIA